MYQSLIRWAFNRFYREFAWTYDAVAALVSGGHWRDWSVSVAPFLRGQVLELGCGTGNLQRVLAAQGTPAIGLDASPQMLRSTRRKLARSALSAVLVRGDARVLPFQNATYDTVVATFPSEYIIAPTTLEGVRRVLRPGGQLVVLPLAQFTRDGLYERLVALAYRLTLQSSPRRTSVRAASLAPRDWPVLPDSRLRRALEQAGFRVDERWIEVPGGRAYLCIGAVD